MHPRPPRLRKGYAKERGRVVPAGSGGFPALPTYNHTADVSSEETEPLASGFRYIRHMTQLKANRKKEFMAGEVLSVS